MPVSITGTLVFLEINKCGRTRPASESTMAVNQIVNQSMDDNRTERYIAAVFANSMVVSAC